MKAYTKDDMKNGMVVQLRRNGKSRGFTVQTDKTIEEIRILLMDFLNKSIDI